MECRFKRKVGYESEGGRLIRNGLPRPGGCVVVIGIGAVGMLATTLIGVVVVQE
jgi:hypothetical protein